jgi:hypothetical protein
MPSVLQLVSTLLLVPCRVYPFLSSLFLSFFSDKHEMPQGPMQLLSTLVLSGFAETILGFAKKLVHLF